MEPIETTNYSIRITMGQREELDNLARQHNRTGASLVRQAVDEWCIRNGYAPLFANLNSPMNEVIQEGAA